MYIDKGFLECCARTSERSITGLFHRLRKYLAFFSGFRPSFRSPTSLVIFPRSEMYRASFLAISLAAGSSFPFTPLLLRRRKPTRGKYYTTISFCRCYFNVAHRHEELYVPRRITLARGLSLLPPLFFFSLSRARTRAPSSRGLIEANLIIGEKFRDDCQRIGL